MKPLAGAKFQYRSGVLVLPEQKCGSARNPFRQGISAWFKPSHPKDPDRDCLRATAYTTFHNEAFYKKLTHDIHKVYDSFFLPDGRFRRHGQLTLSILVLTRRGASCQVKTFLRYQLCHLCYRLCTNQPRRRNPTRNWRLQGNLPEKRRSLSVFGSGRLKV